MTYSKFVRHPLGGGDPDEDKQYIFDYYSLDYRLLGNDKEDNISISLEIFYR